MLRLIAKVRHTAAFVAPPSSAATTAVIFFGVDHDRAPAPSAAATPPRQGQREPAPVFGPTSARIAPVRRRRGTGIRPAACVVSIACSGQ